MYIEVKDKLKYLKKHYPFEDVPSLLDKKLCIHCDQIITVGDYKVQVEYNFFTGKEEEYIVCPNAPECSGTLIDWISVGSQNES